MAISTQNVRIMIVYNALVNYQMLFSCNIYMYTYEHIIHMYTKRQNKLLITNLTQSVSTL